MSNLKFILLSKIDNTCMNFVSIKQTKQLEKKKKRTIYIYIYIYN